MTEILKDGSSQEEDFHGGLFSLIREVLCLTEDREISPDSDFREQLDADSLDLVEVTIASEERYGIELKEEELEGIKTVGQFALLIQQKTGQTTPAES